MTSKLADVIDSLNANFAENNVGLFIIAKLWTPPPTVKMDPYSDVSSSFLGTINVYDDKRK
jgi:hypothetical protein